MNTAARIASIRARVEASLDDPRPRLSADEVEKWIDALPDDAARPRHGGLSSATSA